MGKILLVNYRYFISGGPEKYMFNIINILEKAGHKVIPFSIRHVNNVKTEYEKYFISPIGNQDAVYYNEFRKTPKTILQLFSRSFYSIEVERALDKVIKEEQPDVIYVLHHVNKLSPSIFTAAKKNGTKVVVRLSDFFLMCPRFDFLHNGEICEDCLKGSLLHCVKRSCVQNSKIASAIRVMSMVFHRLIRIYDQVDYFITPSMMLKKKLVEFGFNESKIIHIPTFIESTKIKPSYQSQNYILYLGRLNKEKGVEYLIKAMKHVKDKNLTLKVVGDASDGELQNIKELILQLQLGNVELLGFKSGCELEEIIANAKFSVVPSIWYDNMPNVLLEAFAHGKPVIASNLGSLPEVVDDRVNGLLFEPKNSLDLAEKIDYLNSDSNLIVSFGRNARRKVEEEYNSELHYSRLSEILFGGVSECLNVHCMAQ